MLSCAHAQLLSRVGLFLISWTLACLPLSMRFPRQEYCSGLPFPSLGDLPNPGMEPKSPALAGRFFTKVSPRKPTIVKNKFLSHAMIKKIYHLFHLHWSKYWLELTETQLIYFHVHWETSVIDQWCHLGSVSPSLDFTISIRSSRKPPTAWLTFCKFRDPQREVVPSHVSWRKSPGFGSHAFSREVEGLRGVGLTYINEMDLSQGSRAL